jgi:hypothetical protein
MKDENTLPLVIGVMYLSFNFSKGILSWLLSDGQVTFIGGIHASKHSQAMTVFHEFT